MQKSGLPSKQFLIRGGIATGIVALILIVQTDWFLGLFGKKASRLDPDATVGDVVSKDSNGNGIPDWEERLWGLNPNELYTGDMSNREIIDNKKRALGLTPDQEDENLTETDRLARQLFSISTSLGQEGVDNEGISGAASSLADSIDLKNVTDKYFFKDITTVATTSTSLRAYQTKIGAILANYDDETADIFVVITGVETGDFSGLPQLKTSAATYKKLANELKALSIPAGVAQYHLDIINGLYGMAESFLYLTKIEEDGISGINGIMIYREYSIRFDSALYDISEYLTEYGIL